MASDSKPPPSLEDIDSRLRRARKKDQPGDGLKTPTSNLGRALTLAIEMAAALAVGGGIGWYLDRIFDTKPWLFVVLLLIGFAAGIRNVMRVIARINAEIERKDREKADEDSADRAGDDRG
jgi:ATP synthase protein I